MQKIYLLLRDNKQTGPHSLEELISGGLKSFDLIWVEGRSAGWRYPSEIESLKPYLPEQPGIPQIKSPEPVINQAASFPIASPVEATMKASGKHIFVSMPAGIKQRHIEKIVEEVPVQNIPSPVPDYSSLDPVGSNLPVSEPVSETRYARSLNEVEEDYANWVFKSKRKKTSLQLNQQTVVFGAIGVLVCTLIYFGISKLVAKNNSTTELAKTSIQKPEENQVTALNSQAAVNAPENQTAKQAKTESIPVSDLNRNKIVAKTVISTPSEGEQVVETGNHKSFSNHTGKKSTQQFSISKKSPGQVLHQQTPLKSKEIVAVNHEEAAPQIQKRQQSENKKKGFNAFINGVFGKLKKKNSSPPVAETRSEPEQSIPSETRTNGERRSTRRNDDTQIQSESTGSRDVETVEEKDFSPQATLIELQGSERNNLWQLGVYDLKLTLYNKNNVPIRTAGVDVLYFDENNRLLEKKTVYFNNISSRSHATVRVPDQKWADHTDYRLIALK